MRESHILMVLHTDPPIITSGQHLDESSTIRADEHEALTGETHVEDASAAAHAEDALAKEPCVDEPPVASDAIIDDLKPFQFNSGSLFVNSSVKRTYHHQAQFRERKKKVSGVTNQLPAVEEDKKRGDQSAHVNLNDKGQVDLHIPVSLMDDNSLSVHSLLENIIRPILIASNSCTPERALEILIEASRTSDGRSDLASKNILPMVLELCQNLSSTCYSHLLLLSLKLLRNLCAGELTNQNLFVEHNGVGVILTTLNSVSTFDSDSGMIRMGLQVLANVSLAGQKHQLAIWHKFFPVKFVDIASMRGRETCDPLCMVIYSCCEGSSGLIGGLCGDQGFPILVEIVRTASAVGFGEDWLKLLLSKICFEENQFPQLFSRLCPIGASENGQEVSFKDDIFVSEQGFLLKILSEILNESIGEISISSDFAVRILEILRQVVGAVDFLSRGKSGLPTGSVVVDVLGYSLSILRDICAHDSRDNCKEDGSVDIVDQLLSLGLVELLLCLLRDLEPPATIRKAMKQSEGQEGTTSNSSKCCPYKGFRRDIVAVIGNCVYQRKRVQDEIRDRNGILLLLQQCVTDEDNPFLREWGIWAARNLLERNVENQRTVAELELQGSVDVPEISGLGLRVEVDPKTKRAKLVNV